MKRTHSSLLICIIVFLYLLSAAEVRVAGSDCKLEGTWQGTLELPNAKLRIVFKISAKPDGSFSATMDSPDQGVTGIAVDSVTYHGTTVCLEVRSIGGLFKGELTPGGRQIRGLWKQGPVSLPLSLERIKQAPGIRRPQDPQKPYPYVEKEVLFKNPDAGITLAGSLTVPRGKGPFPAVILVSGSGPQDRNSTIYGHRPFLVLADHLTRRGIAVLRMDDRGVGGSTGNLEESTTLDLAGDVLAAIQYLNQREEIDPKKIGLLGHSEGGLVASLAASRSSEVAFLVLLATPGLPGEEILYLQGELINIAMGLSEDEIKQGRQLQERIFAVVREKENNEEASASLRRILVESLEQMSAEEKKLIADPDEYISIQIRTLTSPWFRFFLSYDPRPVLRKITCPVLAINGSKDLQVPPRENLSAIEKALKAGGNRDITVVELPGLNHLLQTASTGLPAEYGIIQETISPVALELIGDWIVQHTVNDREE